MTTYHKIKTETEFRDYMPTAVALAEESGRRVVGIIQQHGTCEIIEAEAMARKTWGDDCELLGEGDDIEDGVQWLVAAKQGYPVMKEGAPRSALRLPCQ